MMRNLRRLSTKALAFGIVGVTNTVLDAALFFLLLAYVTPNIALANVGAWMMVITWSFVVNSLTTFSDETGGRPRWRNLPGFVGAGLAAISASTIAIVLAAQAMPTWVAKCVAIAVSFAVNFSITNFVVFRSKQSDRS